MPTGTQIEDTGTDGSGITLAWSGTLTYGAYAHVDSSYYLVAPSRVEITGHTPATEGSGSALRNGAMLGSVLAVNRSGDSGFQQAFDGRGPSLTSALAVEYPITVEPGDTIIVARSAVPELRPATNKPQYVHAYLYVHVVAEEPASDAFAPPFLPVNGLTLPDFGDLDLSTLLPDLSLTDEPTRPAMATMEPWFRKRFLDIGRVFNSYQLMANHDRIHYGREIGFRFGDAWLALAGADLADTGSKDLLFQRVNQAGIDIYAQAVNGKRWLPNGGWGQGRKLPMVMMGHCLGVDAARDWGAVRNGKYTFAEDAMTFFVTQQDVDRVLLCEFDLPVASATSNTVTVNVPAGHPLRTRARRQAEGRTIEILSGTGEGVTAIATGVWTEPDDAAGSPSTLTIEDTWDTTPDATSTIRMHGYLDEDIDTPEWGVRHGEAPVRDNPAFNAEYRGRSMNSVFGHALAASFLGLGPNWGHPAFFGYLNRVFVDNNNTLHFSKTSADAMTDYAYDMAVSNWAEYVVSVTAGSISVHIVPPGEDA